jgi:hypothetical protein
MLWIIIFMNTVEIGILLPTTLDELVCALSCAALSCTTLTALSWANITQLADLSLAAHFENVAG